MKSEAVLACSVQNNKYSHEINTWRDEEYDNSFIFIATFDNGCNGFYSHVPYHGNVLEWPRGLTRNCRSGIDRVCSDVVGSAHYDKIGNLAFILGPVRTCVFVDFKALPFGFKNNPSSQAPCRHNCIAYVTYSSNKGYIYSIYIYI